jgi:hypothetical protein
MIANAGARIGRTLLHVGLVEWLVLLYLLVLAGMLVFTPAERHPAPHLVLVLAVLFVLVAAIVVYRKYFEGRPVFRFFFHAIVIAGVMVPFFQLRDMIPLIHPGDVDEQLRALDLRLFGGDAAIWFEQFATPFTSAWFAACYFGYYVVGGSFVVGMMLFCRRQMVFMEFGLVVLGTVCVGTTLYCVFPALGPYVYLADRFLGPARSLAGCLPLHARRRAGGHLPVLRPPFPSGRGVLRVVGSPYRRLHHVPPLPLPDRCNRRRGPGGPVVPFGPPDAPRLPGTAPAQRRFGGTIEKLHAPGGLPIIPRDFV